MGAAKKQRTIDYFQQQGQVEVVKRVAEIVKRVEEKQVEKEKQDEVTDIIK